VTNGVTWNKAMLYMLGDTRNVQLTVAVVTHHVKHRSRSNSFGFLQIVKIHYKIIKCIFKMLLVILLLSIITSPSHGKIYSMIWKDGAPELPFVRLILDRNYTYVVDLEGKYVINGTVFGNSVYMVADQIPPTDDTEQWNWGMDQQLIKARNENAFNVLQDVGEGKLSIQYEAHRVKEYINTAYSLLSTVSIEYNDFHVEMRGTEFDTIQPTGSIDILQLSNNTLNRTNVDPSCTFMSNSWFGKYKSDLIEQKSRKEKTRTIYKQKETTLRKERRDLFDRQTLIHKKMMVDAKQFELDNAGINASSPKFVEFWKRLQNDEKKEQDAHEKELLKINVELKKNGKEALAALSIISSERPTLAPEDCVKHEKNERITRASFVDKDIYALNLKQTYIVTSDKPSGYSTIGIRFKGELIHCGFKNIVDDPCFERMKSVIFRCIMTRLLV